MCIGWLAPVNWLVHGPQAKRFTYELHVGRLTYLGLQRQTIQFIILEKSYLDPRTRLVVCQNSFRCLPEFRLCVMCHDCIYQAYPTSGGVEPDQAWYPGAQLVRA